MKKSSSGVGSIILFEDIKTDVNISSNATILHGTNITQTKDLSISRALYEGNIVKTTVKKLDDKKPSTLALVPREIGDIMIVDFSKHKDLNINRNVLVAWDEKVSLDFKFNKTGPFRLLMNMVGIFTVEVGGRGKIAIGAGGDIIKVTVKQGTPLNVDPDSVVAWSTSLETDVSRKSKRGWFLNWLIHGHHLEFNGNGEDIHKDTHRCGGREHSGQAKRAG